MEYKSTLSLLETEIAIKFIKDTFEDELAKALKLTRVSAPLFVQPESGLNDNLNGYERAVRFDILTLKKDVEIVQSLAKWKRMALAKYGFSQDTGLYTDMNAIRRDEDLDCLHSVYVDQWDWEKIISKEDRTEKTLKTTVKLIYAALRHTEYYITKEYNFIGSLLPEKITFITSEELEERYPTYTDKQREYAAAKEYGAIFLMHIGGALKSGKPHDGRAPDYDDWALNGDILYWNETLGHALEISSMGIRVNSESLVAQLKERGMEARLSLPFHTMLVNGDLPLTIGGGIGQSRLCMLYLQKAHIGEIQASIWPEDMRRECAEWGMQLI